MCTDEEMKELNKIRSSPLPSIDRQVYMHNRTRSECTCICDLLFFQSSISYIINYCLKIRRTNKKQTSVDAWEISKCPLLTERVLCIAKTFHFHFLLRFCFDAFSVKQIEMVEMVIQMFKELFSLKMYVISISFKPQL